MIRLLRLLPHESRNAAIQCQLFNYTLQDSGRRTHPYEALSYVWGDLVNLESISIGGYELPVTQNLYKALSHLRHRSIDRILWVDAVCINQYDTMEKERQIRFMAKIYAQASCVVVWLGECADNSDQALEEIRVAAGGKKSSNQSNLTMIHKAVSSLLQRPWFRRIWVLQEVAAARHVLITCGSAETDGYAFCSGVSLLDFYNNDLDLQSLVRSVIYLIREAIFRPGYATSESGELVDMYHTREATKLHDKVFALLGMSSDDLSKASLSSRYEDPWGKLFQNLTKFLLCDKISTETFGDKQITLIRSKGCILGRVSLVQSDITQGGSQGVEIIFNSISRQMGYKEGSSAHWTLHSLANSIRKGDFVCLLQGASKPTIVRLHDDHFDIIMIAATPPEGMLKLSQSMKPLFRNFLLIWDWEKASREGLKTSWGKLPEHGRLQ
ncbi:HET-domain-containing protein [Mollisia scopiformis]|uniref:HET-domain-containing protein n=1 Tax=Mollisia scopiformis TaxID=149040 RepID=A0A194X0V8_MOLSC|nr:HET-domain-containing protein [Mollisia scopiformis]KUJ13497.1 HET-domain-containing protein [Mollisia scopiformis]